MNLSSTYRIQFHKDFTFADLEKIIPYLHKLGIKTIYASPIFEATPGSMHGYDGTNPNKINPEIGTKEQLLAISAQLKEKGMFWLQDIVPNHLAFHENNKWLMDVVEKGQASAYAEFFDIDWEHPDAGGKLLQPGNESGKTNYRRFFTVDSLISTNIQYDKVFNEYHKLIKELVDKGVFQGLRIDHIDGLYDPTKYLNDLRQLVGDDIYIVVEKILEPGENLPSAWPVQGNSGYDFLGMINKLFTNMHSEYELTLFYYDITGNSKSVEKQVYEKKWNFLHSEMSGDLDGLVRLYKKSISDEYDDKELRQWIAEYLVSCPVYRYYDDDFSVMKIDNERDRKLLKPFYTRCMQFSGPLMAKGVEDTLMYTYNRFVAHNEVGDMPTFFGYTTREFHELMKYRQQHWPLSLNSTSTHDTKRGEDVRARLNVLSDFYEEWIELVKGLGIDGMPDGNDKYFIYQTIVGTYPASKDRIKQYLQKSLREAKTNTNWISPYEEYENAAIEFAYSLIDNIEKFQPFLDKVIKYGEKKSLGQLILKFTCPGIPDTYQGTELWDLSMVDPDNRRPVDYQNRMQLLENRSDSKLNLLHQLLNIRNKYAEVFSKGEYIPLETTGKYKDNIIAFIRQTGKTSILVTVQIHHTNEEWGDTKVILPSGLAAKWENLLTKETIEISNQKFLPASTPALYRSY